MKNKYNARREELYEFKDYVTSEQQKKQIFIEEWNVDAYVHVPYQVISNEYPHVYGSEGYDDDKPLTLAEQVAKMFIL